MRQKRRVAIAAGAGMHHEDLALALGISRVTLAKYFAHELSIGAAAKRLEAMAALYASAMKGRVAAIKAYLAQQPTVAPPPEKPKGKKALAQDAAADAHVGTAWGELLSTKH